MIHVYQGDGKGKTTASVGLCVRAAGHGLTVLFMQFLKDDSSGEITVLRSVPGIDVVHCPVNYGFTFQLSEEQKREMALEFNKMLDLALEADVFLIVLDEIIYALNAGMIDKEKMMKVLDKKCEIVLTGRNVPDWIIEKADYVSNIQKVKHPFDKKTEARMGIEF